MKKVLSFVLVILFIVIIIISVWVGIVFARNNQNNNERFNEKLNQEFKYIENKISGLMFDLNNLNSLNKFDKKSIDTNNSKENNSSDTSMILEVKDDPIISRNKSDINWEYIETELEELLNNWTIILADISSYKDPNDELLKVNDLIDKGLINVKNKEKSEVLLNLSNMYKTILDNMIDMINDKDKIDYAYLESLNWDEIYMNLSESNKILDKIINNNSNYPNKQEIYILAKDLIKSANEKNVDLCYLKIYYLDKQLKNII